MCFGFTPLFSIGFPFFRMPWGTHFSRINYDTCHSDPSSSMNLFWNAHYMDSQARASLDTVPNYNSYCYTPYENTFDSDSYLKDPNYAIRQVQQKWQNSNYCLPFGNQYTWQNNWMTPWGQNNNNSSSSNTNGKLTDDESKKYRKFVSMLKEMAKHPTATSIKSDIEATIKEADKLTTYSEKMAKLETIYKQVDSKAKEDYFINKDKGIYKTDIKEMGYDDNNKDLDSAIEELKEYFSSGKDARERAPFMLSSYKCNINSSTILGFISRWNTLTKKDLITTLKNEYNKDKDASPENPGELNKLMSNLKSALLEKAQSVCNSLPSGSDTDLKKAISALEKKDKNYNSEFNALYKELRNQTANQFGTKFDAEYGFLNDASIKTKIIDTTTKDLNAELSENDDTDTDTDDETVDDNETGTNTRTNTASSKDFKQAMKDDPRACGVLAAKHLIGYTTDAEGEIVLNYIRNINKNNVIDFLKGYYSNRKGGNGFFEQIAYESGNAGKMFKKGDMANVLKAILDYCNTNDKTKKTTPQYIKIQQAYEKLMAAKDETMQVNGLSRCFGFFNWWGEYDQLDDAIEELFNDFKDDTTQAE